MAENSTKTAKPAPGRPFRKGQSGNPGGRPKLPEDFKAKCREFTDSHVVEAWRREVEQQGEHWVKCSELLAAYGHGKPTQGVELGGKEGGDLVIQVVKYGEGG